MALVPEIKLIRTDTTLDLSQKAEKVCFSISIVYLYTFKNIFSRAVVIDCVYPHSKQNFSCSQKLVYFQTRLAAC